MGPPAFWYKVLIHMTVGTTFPRKILNNGKEPCEPLMTYDLMTYEIDMIEMRIFVKLMLFALLL